MPSSIPDPYDRHIVCANGLEDSVRQEMVDLGYRPVRLTGMHREIRCAELLSAYASDRQSSEKIYCESKSLLDRHADLPLMLEWEVAGKEEVVHAAEVFDVDALADCVFIRIVSEACEPPQSLHRNKQSDLHLGVPTSAVYLEFDELLDACGATFIKLEKTKSAPGICRKEGTTKWIVYTLQLDGAAAPRNTVTVYGLFREAVLDGGGFRGSSIMTLEHTLGAVLTPEYPGVSVHVFRSALSDER